MNGKALFFILLVALTLTGAGLIYEKDTNFSELKPPQQKTINGIDFLPATGCLVGSGKAEKGFPLPVLSYEYSCTKNPDNGLRFNLIGLIGNFVIFLGVVVFNYFLIRKKS